MSRSAPSATKVGWTAALNTRYLRMPSVVALIAANLVPLYGVLAWGWDLFELMVLYWMETGIIGLFAITQMALTARWAALFLVPFFIVHFGGFMTGHMVFLVTMFGPQQVPRFSEIPGFVAGMVAGAGFWIAVLALFASHFVSFVLNVLGPMIRGWFGRRPRAALPVQSGEMDGSVMTASYGRVIVMHVTILIGALLVEVFQTKLAAFILLIALKTVVDVAAHVRKNFKPPEPVRVTTA